MTIVSYIDFVQSRNPVARPRSGAARLMRRLCDVEMAYLVARQKAAERERELRTLMRKYRALHETIRVISARLRHIERRPGDLVGDHDELRRAIVTVRRRLRGDGRREARP
jgi:hypothetical protein